MCNHYGTEGTKGMILASFVQMDIPVRCSKHKRVFFTIRKLDPHKTRNESSRGDTKLLEHFTGGEIPDNDTTVIA